MTQPNTYLDGAQTYDVTAAAVVVKTLSGSERYAYRGEILSTNLDPGHLQHLLDAGMIRLRETRA